MFQKRGRPRKQKLDISDEKKIEDSHKPTDEAAEATNDKVEDSNLINTEDNNDKVEDSNLINTKTEDDIEMAEINDEKLNEDKGVVNEDANAKDSVEDTTLLAITSNLHTENGQESTIDQINSEEASSK